MDQQFSLTWAYFQKNLSKGFAELLEYDEFVDVTLAVEGHLLRAHQVILSICSPYFRQMFKTNPCQHPIVVLKDIKYAAMHNLLQFMYNGEVSVKQEDLTSFINTANVLEIKGLSDEKKENYNQLKENTLNSDRFIENHEKNNETEALQKFIEKKTIPNKESNFLENVQKCNTLKRKSDDGFILENTNINTHMKYQKNSNTATHVEKRRKSHDDLKYAGIDNHCNDLDHKQNCEILLQNKTRVKLECESDLDTGPAAHLSSHNYESRDFHESQSAANCEQLNHLEKYKYILSRKGHKQLVHRNFVYTRHSTNHGKTTWRCVQYFSLHRCPATIETFDSTIHNLNHQHNHEDFYDKIIKSDVYEMADVADQMN